MTCKELVELVTDYFEGKLPPGLQEAFENHLAGCGGCRNHIQQMRITIELTGELTEDSVSDDARDELLEVFRNWKNTR